MSGSALSLAVLSLALVPALAGCNKNEDEEAPPVQVPTQNTNMAAPPPGTGGGSAVNTAIPPTPATPTPPSPTPPPAQPKSPTTPKLPDAGTFTLPDAGTQPPPDAGASTADAGPTAPGSGAQACFQRCGAVFQACLTPSLNDAGMPTMKDPAACNAAAEACRKACQP